MKTMTITFAVLCFLLTPIAAGLAAADPYANAIGVFQSSPEVQPFFKNCYAYAIFPTVGKAAVEFAVAGKTAVMPVIKRVSDKPFKWKIESAPLGRIANKEKMLPRRYIRKDGFGITNRCRTYLEPLIQGEDFPPFRNGLPDYVQLKKVRVPRKLRERFEVKNGFLQTVDDDVFRRDPSAMLELFLILQQHPDIRGVSALTVGLIKRNLNLIDDEFRQNPRNHRLFLSILRAPEGVTHQLRRMNLYGVLGLYIPAFGRIVGRMQYDLFHAYTVDEHTLFSNASTTKAMVAAGMLMLVDEGRLDLDDLVIDHLPELHFQDPLLNRQVTVRDLLAHRTGLPRTDFWTFMQGMPLEDQVRRLASVKPAAPLRARHIYQNTMYEIAGLIIERLTGQRWDRFLSERLWRPVGMNETFGARGQIAPGLAHVMPHNFTDGELSLAEWDLPADEPDAAGSVWSSIHDMGLWAQFLLRGGPLRQGEFGFWPRQHLERNIQQYTQRAEGAAHETRDIVSGDILDDLAAETQQLALAIDEA